MSPITSDRHADLRGRLGSPTSSPGTDPRTNRKLLETLAQFGLDAAAEDPVVTRVSPPEELNAVLDAAHEGNESLIAVLPIDDPHDVADRVTRRLVQVQGVDGNTIDLHVYAPSGVDEDVPAVVYIHGGGMAIITADNRVTSAWCREVAASGVVAVGVDFRNAHHGGPNPFPAGLNDCIAAVEWLYEHRAEMGISQIVLQGESGGANLALAVALAANRDGWVHKIAGVYAMVPYISGAYGWSRDQKLDELPSLVENDGYFINCAAMDLLAHSYDPEGEHAQDPLAWPYFATEDDVTGLPPHVISVNELDPLRDEGMAYFRKLQDAGVSVVGRVNLGLTHAADSMLRNGTSEYYDATVADLHRFAASL